MEERKPPAIVLIPSQGFCNRLRALASAHVLSKFLKTNYYVIWEREECCNCPIEDIFTNHFYSIGLEDVANSKYLYMPNTHTNNIMHLLYEYNYIIIKGGHEFKHPDMNESIFLQEKHKFYNSLVFTPFIKSLQESLVTTDCIGIHYRDFVPKYDALDGRNFSQCSPLESFISIVKDIYKNNPHQRFFVSSNTSKAKDAISKIIPKTSMFILEDIDTERNTILGVKYACANLLLLSKCKYIVGTLMSSFSDEACFFNNISKLCIGDEDVRVYHCYGYGEVLNHKMLLPNVNILYDIYKDEQQGIQKRE
ncbi:hypothetical protein QKU58_gp005 [Pyramimonas orientalis virus]|uniref:Uncharacterized protein n=1 Tax=Pyramimonas orientalis virus 01B TaxID=3134525 RepID=A0A7M4CEP1_9VIRU|nr:hypothetical protein QKU58_gp005 [Pyramimonas orientalis virus]QOI90143.1 hypothetical protein HWQ62_00005 [Pyramimonas orientalis virus]